MDHSNLPPHQMTAHSGSTVKIVSQKTYDGREARLRKAVRDAWALLVEGPCKHGVQCEGCRAEWAEATRLLREGLDAE